MKHLIRFVLLVLYVVFSTTVLRAQNINILWFDGSLSYTPGSGVSVIVNPTDTFSIDNRFTLELSDALGNWTKPLTIKEVNEFYTPVINALLPDTIKSGRYKMRIRSSEPEWIEETPSFNVIAGKAPTAPKLSSVLLNNTTYFNCQDNNLGGLIFGSLNQQVGAVTSQMNVAQRTLKLIDYSDTDNYEILLFDILNNNRIPLDHQGSSVLLPDNLPLGTYVIQITRTKTTSTVFSSVFLFHGNGTNLGNSSSEEICVNNSVYFGVDTSVGGIGRNYKGSKYQVSFGDGSKMAEFTQMQLLENPLIEHVFTKASCSEAGSSFSVQIQLLNKGVANSCSAFAKNGTGVKKMINVSVPPLADFKTPAKSCISKSVFFENLTIPGYFGKVGCKDASNFYWYYRKPGQTNYTPVTETSWIDASGNLTLPATEVNVAGCWQVKIEAQNQDLCQIISTNEKSLIIEAVANATFVASADSVCAGSIINFTNTSSVLNQSCSAPVYTWTVVPEKTENASGFTFLSKLDNAAIKFTNPGIYYVKLKIANACGSVNSEYETIYVSGNATVTLPSRNLSACMAKNQKYTLDLSEVGVKPVYNSNYGKITRYNWSISGENVNPDDYTFAKSTSSMSAFPVVEFRSAKKYSVVVTIEGGCQKEVSDTMSLIINEIPELNLSENSQTICSGSLFNPISLGNAAYSWTVRQSTNLSSSVLAGAGSVINPETITNLSDSVGVVEFTISPSNGTCAGTPFTYKVYVKPALKAYVDGSSEFCFGNADARLKLVLKNGISPYFIRYSIDNGEIQEQTTQPGNDTIFLNVATTVTGKKYLKIYSLSDANPSGCKLTVPDSIAYEVVDNPIITTQPVRNQVVCKGAEIVPLSVVCTGNSGTQKVQWFKNTVDSNLGGQPVTGANTLIYKPEAFTEKGDYYFYCVITLNASNCGVAISETARVTVVDDPEIILQQNLVQSVCKNTALKPLEVQAQGGIGEFLYQWYVTNDTTKSEWTKITGATNAVFVPESSTAGVYFYYCEVSQPNLGCRAISTKFSVEVFETPVISKQPLSLSVCKSESSPVLSVEFSGGSKQVNYQWYVNKVKSTMGGMPIAQATEKTYSIPTTDAGTFYYYCQLNFGTEGCAVLISDVAVINVTQFPVVSNQTLEVVSGQRFDFVPVPRGNDYLPADTKYTWALPNANQNSPLSGMTVQTEPQRVISDVIENNSDTIASALYLVTPEVNGCQGAGFYLNVIVLPALRVSVKKQDISCHDDHNGQLEAAVSGGIRFKSDVPYILSWTGPNGFRSSNMRLTNLFPGEYVLTVRDSSGVEIVNKYIIEQPELLNIVTAKFTETNCSGQSGAAIDVVVTGGKGKYTFEWRKKNVVFATTEDLSGLASGDYQLTVTDENGCTAVSQKYNISDFEPIAINVTEQLNNTCYGGENGSIRVDVKGGVRMRLSAVGYDFSWIGPGNFKSNSKDLSNLVSGEYKLIVTDSVGCSATMNVNISQPAEIKIVPYITPATCFGKNDAAVALDVTGGKAPYEVEWSNYATGVYQTNLSAGVYTIKVTDANLCVKTIELKLEEVSPFTVYPTVKQISCNGANDGSIKLAIKSNRTGIKVKWLDGSKAGNERNNLSAGVYAVEVSDGGPCVITNTFVISEPAKLVVSSKVKNSFGCEASNSGAIDINVVGGKSPYSYLWSNGETTKTISNLLPGTYFVTVTDSNGCSVTESFELLRHEPLKIEVGTKISYSSTTGKYTEICTAGVSGGMSPYSYKWSSGTVNPANNAIVEIGTNQTVSLEVTDVLGCSAVYYFKTNIPESNIITQVVDCNGQVYKFDIQTPPSAFTNIEYEWNFGDGTTSNIKSPTHIFLHSGDYAVKLKIKSTEAVLNFETTMTVEALPQLKLDREPRFCKNDSVELIVSGAETYIWNDGTRGNRKVIKKEGNYTVMGISANGCSSTLAFTAKYYDYQNYSIFTDKNVLTLNDPTLKVWSEDVNQTSYKWEFGDAGNDEGNYVNHTYDINSPVTVKVKLNVVNPYGCVETAEKTVWLIMESIPNTFTPNSDGANDRFLKGAKIQIFNSNGIVIYEGTEGWDGTHNGKPVAMDTYYYVVYYSTPEGIVNKPGFVFLAK